MLYEDKQVRIRKDLQIFIDGKDHWKESPLKYC